MCLALVANASWFKNIANSSWFSYLANHTRFTGKLDLKTDNGVKLDYKANVGYTDGKLSLDLANFGAKFNAERQNVTNLTDGEFNRTYNYSGGLVVDHNGYKADVYVEGVAGVAGTINQTNDTDDANVTHTHYTFHSKNKNYWNASSDAGFKGKGGHFSVFNVLGNVSKNGSNIRSKHQVEGATGTCANITKGDEQVGAGFVVKGGKAHIHNHIYLTGDNASEVTFQGHHGKPDAVSNGKAAYKGFTKFSWNNHTRGYTKEGHAEFEGIAWAKSHEDENGTSSGFFAAKNIDFNHKGQIWEDGKKVADTLSVGDIAILKKAGVKINNDGTWEKGYGSTGSLNQWTMGELAGHKVVSSPDSVENIDNEQSRIECMLSKFASNKTIQERCKRLKDLDNHHQNSNGKKFLSKFKANWAHGTKLNGSRTDDNGTNVDFHSGTLYRFGGEDSLDKKPWENHGYKTVSGSYNVDGQSNQPGNFTIQF